MRSKPVDVGTELAARAFAQGFANGADPTKRATRHTVDYATHLHWRAGFEAGRAAIDAAVARYRREALR